MAQPRAKSSSDNSPQDLFGEPSGAPGRVRVLLPLPLGSGYDYSVPDGLSLHPGDFVRVPLGPRRVIGVVWEADTDDTKTVAALKLRPVIERLDVPPQPAVLRRLVEWVAGYTLASRGAVLRMTMSIPQALAPPPTKTAYSLGGPPPDRMTAARERVMAVLGDGPPRRVRDIAVEAAAGDGVVRGLIKAGTLVPVALPADIPFAVPDAAHPGPDLSPDQAAAAAALRRRVGDAAYSVTLLEGVTGAGKTEVYFEAIAAALGSDEQAQILVLVPEIALTAQWLGRFEARFGAAPVEWHSDLTQAQRRRAWRAVAKGQARVVVGARSALFLPFPALHLIVIDEEHDAAFKQEEGVVYHARDMAVVRASLGGFAAILVSATPSLETVVNTQMGRYRRLHLPDRHGGARLPGITVIDLRKSPPERGHWLAPELIAAIGRTFDAGEQTLLFLNRRGYAPLTLCRACGHRFKCPRCTAWLVEHRYTGRLRCHHCDFRIPAPRVCHACGAADSLAACGPGVERIAEEVAATFPAIRAAIMTSDTMTGPRAAADFVGRMIRHELDLVIGTQIVTKGHHFPMLTLVGVIDADLGLSGGDLRAAERTYQQLTQVSGRAGRETRPGTVMLQTYMPEHPVIEALASGDQALFIARESEARRRAALPPFGRLAAIIVSGADADAVTDVARELSSRAPTDEGVTVLGPAPAPLAVLRGRHRWRFLVKAPRSANLQRIIRRWLETTKVPGKVRLRVDIDPQSFL